MNNGKVLGKSILLIILIIILVLAGLLWFDYLGVIQAKKVFAPVYKLFGKTPQTSTAVTSSDTLTYADLDNDRFAKRLEALDIKAEELNKRESDVKVSENENAQLAQELKDKQASQDEREKSFNDQVKQQESRQTNVEQTVAYLNGMPPANAVAILVEMSDQDVIDILRQAEKDAAASDTSSMGSYWLSLMPADRAAEIQRKMANKPASID